MLVFALMNPLSWLLRAIGLVERSLKIAVFIAPVMILGVLAGLRRGPTGVAMGYSAAMLVLVGPLVAWAKHGTGITTADYWDCIKRPLIAGALGGAAGWIFRLVCQNSLVPALLLISEVTISFGVYALLLLFVMGQKDFYVDLLNHTFRRNKPVAAGID